MCNKDLIKLPAFVCLRAS